MIFASPCRLQNWGIGLAKTRDYLLLRHKRVTSLSYSRLKGKEK